MYYAYDPHRPELLEQVRQILSFAAQQDPVLHAYVLLDGTLDQDWALSLYADSRQKKDQVQQLFQGTVQASLEECAPFLCRINPDELETLLARTSEKPMFNLILSANSLSGLRKHLVRFSRAQDQDYLYFPLRLADTVALPHIVHALTPAQQQLFFSGFSAWFIANRAGVLEQIQKAYTGGPVQENPKVDKDSFLISEEAFAYLLDASEPDQFLCGVGNSVPERIEGRSAQELYKMSCFIVTQMRKLGITTPRNKMVAYRMALESTTESEATKALKRFVASQHSEGGAV